jgi:peptidoglycan/xylan/chitin deacetylase (PgdA/CDA1 family)
MIIRRGPKAKPRAERTDAQAPPSPFRKGTEPNWQLIAKVLERDDVGVINITSTFRGREPRRAAYRDFGGRADLIPLAFAAITVGHAERRATARKKGKQSHLTSVLARVRSEWGPWFTGRITSPDAATAARVLLDKLEPYFVEGWHQGATDRGKRLKRVDKIDRAIQTLMSKEKVFRRTPEADRKAIDRADAAAKQRGEELETLLRAEIAQRPRST